jgi:tetratricopeptide (TPR) repeat protein
VISPLLSDPSRGVRIRAAALLAALPAASQPATDRDSFERAVAQFVAAQRLNADRPEARMILGNFYAHCGLATEAEAEDRAALRLAPQFVPAAINLADLYRQLRRDGDGEKVLRSAIAIASNDAGPQLALGLTLIRLKRREEALQELRKAAELESGQPRYAYVYAIALHSAGGIDDSLAVSKNGLAQHPDNRDILSVLVAFNRDARDLVSALEYATHLARITPDDRDLASLVEELRRQIEKPSAK